jgi:hypothetical protein
MTSYFRQVPNFDYVSRLPDAKISDYIQVKNLFKKGKLREDIFQNLAFFEKYKIIGDERPDNVAYKLYDDSTLDWVVLLSNNILNIQSEWPLTQQCFDEYLLSKYEDYDTLYNGVHHYETSAVLNSQGVTIVPAGLQVPETFSTSYYDYYQDLQIDTGNISVPVTNYDYEVALEDKKRNIYILKSNYLNIVMNDMENIMPYKEGSSQYISETLKRGENIRLFN